MQIPSITFNGDLRNLFQRQIFYQQTQNLMFSY